MSSLEQQLLKLVSKHGARGILIDTNVLLLYLFGNLLPSAIGQKRLSTYGIEDAELVSQFVARFAQILTTQHVLAETSNLARQIVGGRLRYEMSLQLHSLFCLGNPRLAQAMPCRWRSDRFRSVRATWVNRCRSDFLGSDEYLVVDGRSRPIHFGSLDWWRCH